MAHRHVHGGTGRRESLPDARELRGSAPARARGGPSGAHLYGLTPYSAPILGLDVDASHLFASVYGGYFFLGQGYGTRSEAARMAFAQATAGVRAALGPVWFSYGSTLGAWWLTGSSQGGWKTDVTPVFGVQTEVRLRVSAEEGGLSFGNFLRLNYAAVGGSGWILSYGQGYGW